MNKKEILNYLKEHKEEFKKKFGIEKFGLFGSFARDKNSLNSDIDLIIFTKNKSLKNRLFLKKLIEKDLNREVDLGYFDSLREFIKQEIKKDLIYV